jgi:hypothetical protein
MVQGLLSPPAAQRGPPPAQSAGRPGRRQQFRGHAVQPGGELRRQPVGVANRADCHSRAAGQGEDVAIPGAGLGTVVPVDGAGGAQSGQTFRSARAGAAAAMHAAAEFSPDGRSAAGTAGAGAGATARCKPEVGVAAAFWRGRLRDEGGADARVWHPGAGLGWDGWCWSLGGGHGGVGPDCRVSSLFFYIGCISKGTAIRKRGSGMVPVAPTSRVRGGGQS